MLLIVVSRSSEAKAFIRRFALKRSKSYAGREIYRSEDVLLTVSGAGAMKACAAATALIENVEGNEILHVVHFGACSAVEPYNAGDIVLANKITDGRSGKSYYPDIIFKHGFPEAALLTLEAESANDISPLTDDDAAGFCEAVSAYLPSSRFSVLKIVRDNRGGFLERENEYNKMIENNLDRVCNFLEMLEENMVARADLEPEWQREIRSKLEENLRLTFYQRTLLSKLLLPHSNRGKELLGELKPFLEMKATSKMQQRDTFERIKELLIA